MTVIAWDGKTLAADKRSTTDDGAINVTTKIERIGDALVATSGTMPISREVKEWYRAGADPATWPASAREDKMSLIVITRDRIAVYTIGPQPQLVEGDQSAWGCGRDFARAALALGKSAAEAVEIACGLNAFCGNGVDTLTLS